MNKKIVSVLSLVVLGGAPILSATLPAYATTVQNQKGDVNEIVNQYEFVYISQLSHEKQDIYRSALSSVLGSRKLSYQETENVLRNIDRLAAKENQLIVQDARGSFWDGQGITTDELGATIDTALIILSGGGFSGAKAAISALISRVGRQKAIEIIVEKLVQLGLGAFKQQLGAAVGAMIYLTSPGKGIAEFIDSIDFYPNNGRINLWA